MNLTLPEVVLRHELAHAYAMHALGVKIVEVCVIVKGDNPWDVRAYSIADKGIKGRAPTSDFYRATIVTALAGPAYTRRIESAYGDGEAMDMITVARATAELALLGEAPDMAELAALVNRLLDMGAGVIESVATGLLPLSCERCDLQVSGQQLYFLFNNAEKEGV